MSEPNNEAHETEGNSPKKPRTPLQKRWLFFGTLAVIFVAAYCLVNVDSFTNVFSRIGDVLSPVFIGCIIAYLCNPILKMWEYTVFRKLGKHKLRLTLSMLCTGLTVIAILAGLVALILPELIRSISELVNNYETYLNRLLNAIQAVIEKLNLNVDISDMEKLTAFVTNMMGDAENIMDSVLNALKSVVLDTNLLASIWSFVSNLFGTIIDFVLGIFIAVYILTSKEKRVAQFRKFRAAYLNEKQNRTVVGIVKLIDKTFGGFFKGILIDALAVGIMMYIALSIFHISEYNLLIASICAITNVIPVFGPWIGAIPSVLIILMTGPEKVLAFAIIVLVVQQLDANILVPLIQGNNTGISSLSVLIAIAVMGGLFGIPGMILGVPVFAVIIELIKRAVDQRLISQNKETNTTHYYRRSAIGNAEEEVYYEHAHWKYKYDHSRIKPHVDKVLATLSRKRRRKTAATAGTTDAPVADATETETPKTDATETDATETNATIANTQAEDAPVSEAPTDTVTSGVDKE
ncbi:MAG: AI-2E family transporter [Clostridia bacterium]|nr:AI-2E family transporter [Clostridia bacterium]